MKLKITCILFISLSFFEMVFAQQRNITGTVTDTQGLPLPGVNITVKETSRGVQTDFDGNYSIQAETGEILVFSFVGLRTREVVVGEDKILSVVLETDAAELDAVVVTALGVKDRRDP